MTPKWLELANSNAGARAMAAGAEGFLVAHNVPGSMFAEAAARGEYVSMVFRHLDKIGRKVREDRIGAKCDDADIADFWKDEIKRAAGQRSALPRATND